VLASGRVHHRCAVTAPADSSAPLPRALLPSLQKEVSLSSGLGGDRFTLVALPAYIYLTSVVSTHSWVTGRVGIRCMCAGPGRKRESARRAGAPCIITPDLVRSFNISVVVRGTISETTSFLDLDRARYAWPQAQDMFRRGPRPHAWRRACLLSRLSGFFYCVIRCQGWHALNACHACALL
jgi:hypothetical protein